MGPFEDRLVWALEYYKHIDRATFPRKDHFPCIPQKIWNRERDYLRILHRRMTSQFCFQDLSRQWSQMKCLSRCLHRHS